MKLFGYELSLQKAARTDVAPRTGSTAPLQARWVNGTLRLYSTATDSLITESFLRNSDLYSVVSYIIRKTRRAKFYLYEVKDKKALDEFMCLKSEGVTGESYSKAQTIKQKALVETSNPDIEKLLSTPNPDQNWGSFCEQAVAYKLLTGERMIHKIRGLSGLSQLYILPPVLMDVVGGSRYMSVDKFVFQPTQQELSTDEVQFSKTFYPAIGGTGDELRGLSPLKVLALSIQKSNEGFKAGIKQYLNAGPPGILSFPEADMTPDQADDYEYRLQSKEYGRNRQIHISSARAEWTQIGLSPVDLDLMKSLDFDLRSFCRAYGIDSKVISDPTSSTFNNMAEARKAAIVDAIVPEVESLAEDLRACIEVFNTNGKRYFIDGDVSHFPELAEDINKQQERLSKMWELSPNQRLEALQYERYDNPLFDEPWIPMGITPLSEYAASQEANPAIQPKNDGSY